MIERIALSDNLQMLHTNHRLKWVFLVVVSLLGAFMVLVATAPGGLILTQDSYHFIAGSRGFMTGHGFLRYTNVPTASWPPLYPILIAGITPIATFTGSNVLDVARILHAAVFALTIFTGGLLMARYLRTGLFLALGVLSLLFGFTLLRDVTHLWTESLYILLSIIFFLRLPIFLEEKRPYQLVILMAITILGSTVRFGGIGVLLAGSFSILLLMRAGWRARVIHTAVFALSGIPAFLWILYSYSLPLALRPYAWSQTRPDPLGVVADNLQRTLAVLEDWFFPPLLQGAFTQMVAGIGVIVVVGWVVYDYRRQRPTAQRPVSPRRHPITIAVYLISFMAFLLVYMAFTVNTPLDHRHLSIFYPFVIVLIFYGLERLANNMPKKPAGYAALGLVIGLWFVQAVATTVNQVHVAQHLCCDQTRYSQVPMLDWLKANVGEGTVYSNTTLPLLYTSLPSFLAPATDADMDAWLKSGSEDEPFLAWFINGEQYGGAPGYNFSIDYPPQFAESGHLEMIASFDEGVIYRVKHNINP